MTRYDSWTFVRELGYWLLAVPVLAPIYLVANVSLRSDARDGLSSLSPTRSPSLENYSRAWSEAGSGTVSFADALVNSAFITVTSVVVLVAVGSMAGYFLARRTSRIASWLLGLFMVGLVLPFQLGLIPLYIWLVEAGLVGTKLGLIIVYVGLQMPLAVFLYTGFFRALPRGYEEAAAVEGASQLRVFWQIAFPLVRPITAVVAILTGLFVWNDFFVALVVVGTSENATLPIAVYSFVGRFAADWNLIFASAVIALIPVLVTYLLIQRTIMKSFTATLRG